MMSENISNAYCGTKNNEGAPYTIKSEFATLDSNYQYVKREVKVETRITDYETELKLFNAKLPLQLNEQKKKSKKELDQAEREKMQLLVSHFTEDQLDRYEMYRRASFPRASIKRMMQIITGNSVAPNVVIAMAGMAKVFVGEVVEEGLDYMEQCGESGPLQPKHLREAVRRHRKKGKIPCIRGKKSALRL